MNPRRKQYKIIRDKRKKVFRRSKEQTGTGKKAISKDSFDEMGAGISGMMLSSDLAAHGTGVG
eukprot:3073386-Pyramimonas_sp.AAC.1